MNIQIISGTDRSNSNALRVSHYLQRLYVQEEVTAGICDLQEFPLTKVSGGPYGKEIPAVDRFIAPLLEADGWVVVCPEYNGGYPGILKLLIDYLPFPKSLHKKPVCFVGEATGSFGAMRAVEQLQQVVGYRNGHVFPERVFIPRIHKNFDEMTGIKDDIQQELLENQVYNFVQFVHTFANVGRP